MRLHLKVKFRAFGITFGNIEKYWTLDEISPFMALIRPKILFNDRGVLLEIAA